MYRFIVSLIFSIFFFLAPMSSTAQSVFDPMEASIEENLSIPAVSTKAHPAVVSAMVKLKSALKRADYCVETMRNDEVVMITIPADKLFSPNKTELTPKGETILKNLVPHVLQREDYKVILAVHSDNSGDELFRNNLTADRANAIDDFFYRSNGNTETGIIPYGIGDDEPLVSNISIANRAKNRRVEIYFVPTEAFIIKARKQK